MGFIYVLDRETGEPLFPVEERPVPDSNIPGEEAWPTQPFPVKPESFSKQQIAASDIMGYSDESYQSNKQYIDELWFKGLFTPLDFNTTVMYPGSRGGAEWGGGAYDPVSGTLFINSNQQAELGKIAKVRLNQNQGETLFSVGEAIYLKNCASCHGVDRQGVESMPALNDLTQRLSRNEMVDIISNGNGMMPAFSQVLQQSQEELLAFLSNTGKDIPAMSTSNQDTTSSYRNVINKQLLLDTLGRPMTKPPWGTLHAINLHTGDFQWTVPLGNYPELQTPGGPPTGMENYGGPVVTAGGLVIIGASMDRMLRAFDKDTGELLWEEQLPGNGLANPAVYQVNGRQYISIAVSIGESFNHTKSGIVTYSLPSD
jgi:quinoprotein glucose dehydrogenase